MTHGTLGISLGNALQVKAGTDQSYETPSVGMDDGRTWECHSLSLLVGHGHMLYSKGCLSPWVLREDWFNPTGMKTRRGHHDLLINTLLL